MLRAILSRKTFDTNSGLSTSDMFSIDFDNQEIEEALSSGGSGPSGYDITDFVGVEVLCNVEADNELLVSAARDAISKIEACSKGQINFNVDFAERLKQALFMVENGLGPEDMENDIAYSR